MLNNRESVLVTSAGIIMHDNPSKTLPWDFRQLNQLNLPLRKQERMGQ